MHKRKTIGSLIHFLPRTMKTKNGQQSNWKACKNGPNILSKIVVFKNVLNVRPLQPFWNKCTFRKIWEGQLFNVILLDRLYNLSIKNKFNVQVSTKCPFFVRGSLGLIYRNFQNYAPDSSAKLASRFPDDMQIKQSEICTNKH